MATQAPDVLEVKLSIGELCGLVAAAVAFGVAIVIAENLRQGLVIAAGTGLLGYAQELLATIVAVTIAGIWALIVGLGVQIVAAHASVWLLSRRREGKV